MLQTIGLQTSSLNLETSLWLMRFRFQKSAKLPVCADISVKTTPIPSGLDARIERRCYPGFSKVMNPRALWCCSICELVPIASGITWI